jgi:hypothetical protein
MCSLPLGKPASVARQSSDGRGRERRNCASPKGECSWSLVRGMCHASGGRAPLARERKGREGSWGTRGLTAKQHGQGHIGTCTPSDEDRVQCVCLRPWAGRPSLSSDEHGGRQTGNRRTAAPREEDGEDTQEQKPHDEACEGESRGIGLDGAS